MTSVSERNSLAYQSGLLLIKQREAAEMLAAGTKYRQMVAHFGVSRETLRKWIRRHLAKQKEVQL